MGASLRRKLSRLRQSGLVKPAASLAPSPERREEPESPNRARVAKLRGLIAKMVADDQRRLRESPRPDPVVRPLPGEVVETAHGPLHRVATYLEPQHAHGRVPIAGALEVSPPTVARLALDEGLASVDPERLLFLDTETTGLAGGTGTLPFLIGIAWFEDQSLRVEQLLLRQPGEETPMLEHLAERVRWASALVTYNGKSYDWPLLRTRAVLNRVALQMPAAHLDLLHCARRIFQRRLRRVPLTHMEEEVLGMRRERDISGAEIPDLFWEYVRGGDGERLAPVIEHNANDMIALAALVAVLARRYDAPEAGDEPEDRLGVAQVAWRADDEETARLHAHAAAKGGGGEDVTADALVLAAEIARRGGDDEERVSLLHRALAAAAHDEPRRSAIHLMLAKLYEHRLKDLERALIHAHGTAAAEGEEARDHRLARLRKRIVKAAEKRAARSRRRASERQQRLTERAEGPRSPTKPASSAPPKASLPDAQGASPSESGSSRSGLV